MHSRVERQNDDYYMLLAYSMNRIIKSDEYVYSDCARVSLSAFQLQLFVKPQVFFRVRENDLDFLVGTF